MLYFYIAASDLWPPLPERIRGVERTLFWERAGVRAIVFRLGIALTHGLRM
jgi:hypothetical protein